MSNVVINNNNYSCGGNAGVKNLYAESREIFEKLLVAKDEQIALLKVCWTLLRNKWKFLY
jgi:hypothetical protein